MKNSRSYLPELNLETVFSKFTVLSAYSVTKITHPVNIRCSNICISRCFFFFFFFFFQRDNSDVLFFLKSFTRCLSNSCFLSQITHTDSFVVDAIDTFNFDGIMPAAILLVIIRLLNIRLVHCYKTLAK